MSTARVLLYYYSLHKHAFIPAVSCSYSRTFCSVAFTFLYKRSRELQRGLWLAILVLVYLSSSITLISFPTVCAFLIWCGRIKTYLFYNQVNERQRSRRVWSPWLVHSEGNQNYQREAGTSALAEPTFSRGLQRPGNSRQELCSHWGPLGSDPVKIPCGIAQGQMQEAGMGISWSVVHINEQAGSEPTFTGCAVQSSQWADGRDCRGSEEMSRSAGAGVGSLQHSWSTGLAGINNRLQTRNKPGTKEI